MAAVFASSCCCSLSVRRWCLRRSFSPKFPCSFFLVTGAQKTLSDDSSPNPWLAEISTDAQGHIPPTPFLSCGDGCLLRKGLSQRIQDVNVEWTEYTGFFDGFEVCTMQPCRAVDSGKKSLLWARPLPSWCMLCCNATRVTWDVLLVVSSPVFRRTCPANGRRVIR